MSRGTSKVNSSSSLVLDTVLAIAQIIESRYLRRTRSYTKTRYEELGDGNKQLQIYFETEFAAPVRLEFIELGPTPPLAENQYPISASGNFTLEAVPADEKELWVVMGGQLSMEGRDFRVEFTDQSTRIDDRAPQAVIRIDDEDPSENWDEYWRD
ncbi:MAG: hypothetical protein V4481_03115 [Patescibacteria group bacterium]